MDKDTLNIAKSSRKASHVLSSIPKSHKSSLLHHIHAVLRSQKSTILAANSQDLALAKQQVQSGKLSESLVKRLELNDEKFETLLQGVLDVEKLPDPTNQITLARKLDNDLDLYRVTAPIGVLLCIFEARPEVVTNISCLAIKSGNAVILKGGSEAGHSNKALHDALTLALETYPVNPNEGSNRIPKEAIQLVSKREEIADLLKMDDYIDLVIPRGSNQLVKYIQGATRIPVLGHADGICSVYVDISADIVKASRIVLDAKTNYPAACNSTETLLLHSSILSTHFPPIAKALLTAGVTLRCDDLSLQTLSSNAISTDFPKQIQQSIPEDFDTEFLNLTIAIKVVDSISEAIEHIHTHGSGHTDSIITESEDAAKLFMNSIDSAGVYWNASTRFADGFRYGFGAEIGVSTNKTHARGPVGLEGLVIYRYRVVSRNQEGSIVAEYGIGKKRQYLHKDMGQDEIGKLLL